MNGKRAIKENESGKRCGHKFCGDCHTKRGSRRGNRHARQTVRRVLRRQNEET